MKYRTRFLDSLEKLNMDDFLLAKIIPLYLPKNYLFFIIYIIGEFMQKFFYIIYSITIIISILFINQSLNFKNTAWLPNSPKIISLSSTNLSMIFSVSEPATIYWRIYATNSPSPSIHDFTNSFKLQSVLFYGGGLINQKNGTYTNHISTLSPDTAYIIYSIAISRIGRYPKIIKSLSFKTLKTK